MLKKLALLSVTAAAAMAMHTAEININEKDIEANLLLDMGQFNHSVDPDAVFLGFGYLAGDKEHSDPKGVKNGIFSGQFKVQQEIARGLVLGVGLKLIAAKEFDKGFYALPVGASINYEFPLDIATPLYIGGQFYYSPEVLSFENGKNYIEYRAMGGIKLMDRASLEIGFRHIDLNFETPRADLTYNESAYFGLKFSF